MSVVYFLLVLLAVLIVYTMLSTIIKLSLYITTSESYEHSRLVIPVILSILIWALVGTLCAITIYNRTQTNVINEFFNIYLQKGNLMPLIKLVSQCAIIYYIIGILLQSITYYAVNIKLENLFSSIRFALKKLFRIGKKKEQKNLTLFYEIPGISIFRALFTSLLTTVMMTCFVVLLFAAGIHLSTKLGTYI